MRRPARAAIATLQVSAFDVPPASLKPVAIPGCFQADLRAVRFRHDEIRRVRIETGRGTAGGREEEVSLLIVIACRYPFLEIPLEYPGARAAAAAGTPEAEIGVDEIDFGHRRGHPQAHHPVPALVGTRREFLCEYLRGSDGLGRAAVTSTRGGPDQLLLALPVGRRRAERPREQSGESHKEQPAGRAVCPVLHRHGDALQPGTACPGVSVLVHV